MSLNQQTSDSTYMQQGDPQVENVQWGPERWAEAAAGLAASLFPSSSPTPVQTHIPAPFPDSSPNCQQLFRGQGGYPETDSWKDRNPRLCQPTPKRPDHATFQQPPPRGSAAREGPSTWTRDLSPGGAQKVEALLRIWGGKGRWKGLGLMTTQSE